MVRWDWRGLLVNALWVSALQNAILGSCRSLNGSDELVRLEDSVWTLQSYFEPGQGTYPSGIDWTTAFVTSVLSGALQHLPNLSERLFTHLAVFYHRQNVRSLRFQAYDDQQWVVLGWLDAADLAAEVAPEWVDPFLARAEEFYSLAKRGWDESTCHGGMFWKPPHSGPSLPYKNTITNELFVTSSVQMYLTLGDREYLDNALKAWTWLESSGLRNQRGLFADGVHFCKMIEGTVWTYNQAVLLSGLAGLFLATGDSVFLDNGYDLIEAVLSSWLVRQGGVLTERCDPSGNCNQDQNTFKAVYFYHFGKFCQVANCSRYRDFVDMSADAAYRTQLNGLTGDWWFEPHRYTLETHAGGVSVFLAQHILSDMLDE